MPDIKNNAHIRSDEEAFMASYERARAQLGKIPGVVGVGYGLKETEGNFSDDIALLVYLLEKRDRERVPAEQLIPPTFEGYRTDVRVLLPGRNASATCNDDSPHPVITGGIQIEAFGKKSTVNLLTNGTLGCIVRKRGDRGDDNVYLLTNHHVLLHEDIKTVDGDGVYHPYCPRTIMIGNVPLKLEGTQLGKIDVRNARKGHVDKDGKDMATPSTDPAPLLETIDTTFTGFYVDCAAVRIDLGSFCCGKACPGDKLAYDSTIPGLNDPADTLPGVVIATSDTDRVVNVRDVLTSPLTAGERVYKVGRTTRRTVGRITAINAPAHNILNVPLGPGLTGPYEKRVLDFRYNVIEVVLAADPPAENCMHRNAFSHEGDSGSLVVDENNNAVGLLFQSGEMPNSAGKYSTSLCAIVPVLNALKFCIATTTGTSHGAEKAVDGSGLASSNTPESLLAPENGVVLVGGEVRATQSSRTAPPLAASASDAQREHMLALLEAFRETSLGRELHETFGEVRREIAYLVRGCRPVKVVWHRNRGPAFLASAIDHVRGGATSVPRVIGGVSRAELLVRMGEVLSTYGSNPLRDAIERHRAELLDILAHADNLDDCLAALRRMDAHGVPA